MAKNSHMSFIISAIRGILRATLGITRISIGPIISKFCCIKIKPQLTFKTLHSLIDTAVSKPINPNIPDIKF